MDNLWHFFRANPLTGFMTSIIVFLITIFLVVKKWIGFSIAFLLLLFSIAAGLAISNQQALQSYFNNYRQPSSIEDSQSTPFAKQMQQAIEDLKIELEGEKVSIGHMMNQIQELFDQVDEQKQKLQHFIEKTRDHFKGEEPSSAADSVDSSISPPLSAHQPLD